MLRLIAIDEKQQDENKANRIAWHRSPHRLRRHDAGGHCRPLVSGANQEKAWSTGDIEAGMVTVGMCGGLINDVPSCEELVSNIVSDAEQIISERLAPIIAA